MKSKQLIKRAHKLAEPFRVDRGKEFRLKDVDPNDTLEFDKDEDKPRAKEALAIGVDGLADLQDKLYAQDRWAVLLIFQAMDAAGKDGAIKHVMSGVNPQGCQVSSFKSPSAEDLDHDYLWRCIEAPARSRPHRHLQSLLLRRSAGRARASGVPRAGRSCRPNSSTKHIWNERFEDIRNFEHYLSPQRRRRPQVLPSRFEGGTETPLPRAHRRPGQELEILRQRRRASASTGTTTWTPTKT